MLSFSGVQGAQAPAKIPHPPAGKRSQNLQANAKADADLTPEQEAAIRRLADATIPIFENNHCVGTGVAISSSLILTSADCGFGRYLQIKPQDDGGLAIPLELSVIFQSPDTHFKILSLPFLLSPPQPISLGGMVGSKGSIQMKYNPCAKEKEVTRIANKVDLQSPQMSPPLSPRLQGYADLIGQGAPIMALENGKVYAIRHDDSTLLNVFDIYAELQKTAAQEQDSTAASAATLVLEQIGIFDCKQVDLRIPLDRDPSTKKRKDCIKSCSYGFTEANYGTGIKIWPQLKLYEHQTYTIIPSPKNPTDFEDLAKYLGREWFRTGQPPQELSAHISDIQYSLTLNIPCKRKHAAPHSPRNHMSPLNSPRKQVRPLNSPRNQMSPLNSPRGYMNPMPSPRGYMDALNSPRSPLNSPRNQVSANRGKIEEKEVNE